MNENGVTNFESRLNSIIGVEETLDSLDENGEEKLNLPSVVVYDQVKTAVVRVEGATEDLIDDYKHSRNIMYGLIERGTVALEGALMIARESEHPRAYEVTATLMKNISEMTKDLLNLQKAINGEGGQKAGPIGKQINIQNNFNGMPSDEDFNMNDLLDGLDD